MLSQPPATSPIHRTSDVLIAGAGIIGLSAALELARFGLSVTVIDQGYPMREASWAAAGMLAAGDPENPPALRSLADLSLKLYPGFLAEVEGLSDMAVPLRTTGTWQGSRSGASSVEARDKLLAEVPDLQPGTRRFSRFAEHSLDPRDLCVALPLAVRAAGVTLLENTRVRELRPGNDTMHVFTDAGNFLAQSYLHCCGAWSGLPLTSGANARIPVEPRKGQMVSVAMPPGAPVLRCVLRTPELYLIPRGDGRIIIGATVERTGFDRSVSPSAIAGLLEEAAVLWPPIRCGAILEQWSGLRPATPDALPILDSVAPHAWIATGHFRNGILLAPATAHLLTQLVLGGSVQVDLTPFRLARFAPAAALV